MTYINPPIEQAPSGLKALFDAYMESNVPGWQPNEANPDDRMAAAWSVINAQLMEAASDVATSIFRWFGAEIAGVPPMEARPAQGITTWTAIDANGPYVIDAGAVVYFTDGAGNKRQFATVEVAVIPNGQTTISGVAVQASEAGEAGDNISGLFAGLGTPYDYITSVELTAATSGGQEAESDESYLNRLRERFRTLSSKPIEAQDFSILALQHPNVGRAVTIATWNPTATATVKGTLSSGYASVTKVSSVAQILPGTKLSGTGIPTGTTVLSVGTESFTMSASATASGEETITLTGTLGNGGCLTTYVADDAGTELTTGEEASLQAATQAQCLAGVEYFVGRPTYTTVNVAVTAYVWPGQNVETAKAAIEEAIRGYISPESWGRPTTAQTNEWVNDSTVRLVNVEHRVLSIPGLHYIGSLTLNGETLDVPLAGVAPLPTLGTLSVTVDVG